MLLVVVGWCFLFVGCCWLVLFFAVVRYCLLCIFVVSYLLCVVCCCFGDYAIWCYVLRVVRCSLFSACLLLLIVCCRM